MKYILMTIPDDPGELRDWLNGIVARGEARTFARELCATRGLPQRAAVAPEELAAIVRREGSTALNDLQLRQVLSEPGLFVSLAEDVFLAGGDFWAKQFDAIPASESRVAAGRTALLNEIAPVIPLTVTRSPRRSYAPYLASCVTAAVLLIAFGLYSSFKPQDGRTDPQAVASSQWGWQKADELNGIAEPAEYYTRIAELAEEWNTQDTSTPIQLAQRITEFRAGCARLQLMPHKPLNEAQRQALLERCRKWAKKFDESLAALETTGDTAKVRADMNATVKQLTTVLRADAAKLRSA